MKIKLIQYILAGVMIVSIFLLHAPATQAQVLETLRISYQPTIMDIDEEGDVAYIYSPGTLYESNKRLVVLDLDKLEVKNVYNLKKRIWDMKFKQGKLFISQSDKWLKVFDPEIGEFKKLEMDHQVKNFDIVENEMIYYDSPYTNGFEFDVTIYRYNFKTNHEEKLNQEPLFYTDNEHPYITMHPNKNIVYLRGSRKTLAIHPDEFTEIDKFFNAEHNYFDAIHFYKESVIMEGKERSLTDLEKVRHDYNTPIKHVKENLLFTENAIIDAETHKVIKSFNLDPKPSTFLADVEEQLIYTIQNDMGNVYIKKIALNEEQYEDGSKFKDLIRFEDEIYFLKRLGIIQGFTEKKFGPKQPIKRVDAVRMIIRERDIPLTDIKDPEFSDLKPNSPGFEPVAKAKELGIIDGLGDGTFAPNGRLKRSDMAKILAQAYHLDESSQKTFKDVSPEHRAYPYVSALAANKITIGFPDGSFRPNQNITRQEFAAFMARHLNSDFIGGTNK